MKKIRLGTILMAAAVTTATGCKTGEGGTCAKPEDCGSGLRCGQYETCVSPETEHETQKCKDGIEGYVERAVAILNANSSDPVAAAAALSKFVAATEGERKALLQKFTQFRATLTPRKQESLRTDMVVKLMNEVSELKLLYEAHPELRGDELDSAMREIFPFFELTMTPEERSRLPK